MSLTQGFVEDDGRAGGQIKTAGRCNHGNGVESPGPLRMKGGRESCRFRTKNKERVFVVRRLCIGCCAFARKKEKGVILLLEVGGEVVDLFDGDSFPIVETGSFEPSVLCAEAEGANENEAGGSGRAGADDVTGILGYLGLKKEDLHELGRHWRANRLAPKFVRLLGLGFCLGARQSPGRTLHH